MAEIRCTSCGQKNRVGELKPGQTAVCGKCKSPLSLTNAGTVTITDANFESLVRSGGPIVVDFWAAWCGPCRIVGPIIENLAAERSDVRFGKLNVDENPATSARFVVSSIPTLIFFADGKEKDRLTGAAPKPHIERWIAQQMRA
jgi:thioredoxin 2